jgi:2-phosphosulfolactate phosphatase
MKVDVAFAPSGLGTTEVAGRTVFVIDVLRASTTVAAALAHGARRVIPMGSIDEAIRLAQSLERQDTVLAGERNASRISGFDLGNSPLEMTEAAVDGKTIVMTTTNGTRALLATTGAAEVYLAAAVNLSVAAARARQALDKSEDLLLLCAGREGVFGLDDAYTAGRILQAALGGRRGRKGFNDAALVSLDLARRYGTRWLRPLLASRAGRHLVELGFKQDVVDAATEDNYPVLPQFADRRITLGDAP